jgi:5'-3' exonuclease
MREVLLIDLGSVYWAAWHSSVNDEVSAAHDRAISHVRKLAGEMQAVAICCDSPRSLRREKHPEYKAQRPVKDHASVEQLARTIATLRRDGYTLWESEGYEADDVIASAVAGLPDCRILIASADKDLLQLVQGDRVRVVSTKTGSILGPEDVKAKLGVYPGLVRDWLALVGDTSDNVRGVPGIGPVKAAALLNEFGSIDAIMNALQSNVTHAAFKPALRTALLDPVNLRQLVTATSLVTLEAAIDLDWLEVFEPRTFTQHNAGPPDVDFDDDDAAVFGPRDDNDDAPASEAEPAPARPPAAPPPPPRPPAAPAPASEPRAALARLPEPAPLAPIGAPRSTASAGLAVTEAGSLQPNSLAAAWKLAGALYESGLYHRFRKQEAIFAIIIRGREMGLSALTSLDMFHIVEGKPAPHAHLLIARAKQHVDCEYFRFVGGDLTFAEFETKHRANPEPTRLRYTIEDAKRAGLIKAGSNWEKRPAEMLRKTAGVQLARLEYPEALGGLYASEELAA